MGTLNATLVFVKIPYWRSIILVVNDVCCAIRHETHGLFEFYTIQPNEMNEGYNNQNNRTKQFNFTSTLTSKKAHSVHKNRFRLINLFSQKKTYRNNQFD